MQIYRTGKEKTMNILSFTVGGYSNIPNNTTVHLSSKTTAFVALNNYGKSNLLEAINCGIEFIRSKEEYGHIKLNKPISNHSNEFYFSFKFETLFDEKIHYVNYGYIIKFHGENRSTNKIEDDMIISSEWLNISASPTSARPRTLIYREDGEAFMLTTKTGRCDKEINVKYDELIINKLIMADGLDKSNLFYINIINEIHETAFIIDRSFDVQRNFDSMFNILRIRNERLALKYYLGNSSKVLHDIKEKHEDLFIWLKNSFLTLFPEISDIFITETKIDEEKIPEYYRKLFENIEIDNNRYSVSVYNDRYSNVMDIMQMSDGVRRMLVLLITIVMANIKNYNVIAIEEPENSIHPSLLRDFLNIVENLAGNCKIILTSHSPYIVQYINPSDIYIGIPNNRGNAHFSKLKSKSLNKLSKYIKEMGMNFGDFIFEALSEFGGNYDELKEYLEDDWNESKK